MPNYPLSDPFFRDFIFDEVQQKHITQKLKEHEPDMKQAKTYGSDKGINLSDIRSCYNVSLRHREFFDVSYSLKEATEAWYPEVVPNLWYDQLEFVRYLPPAQTFQRHQDDKEGGPQHDRIYTTVTMVDKSDDLEGGLLRIWLPNTEKSIDIDLEPFETVIFPAHFFHEATPVFKGRRVILIAWGGKELPSKSA